MLEGLTTGRRRSAASIWPIASHCSGAEFERAAHESILLVEPLQELTGWKLSPVDAAAQDHWRDYSRARDAMLTRTHHQYAPWAVVRADREHDARLNVIRDILARVAYPGARKSAAAPDPEVAREFTPDLIGSGWLAR